MKVLHLPVNVALQMSATVRGLRAIGVDATGLAMQADICLTIFDVA
jgi:hypothetical protein